MVAPDGVVLRLVAAAATEHVAAVDCIESGRNEIGRVYAAIVVLRRRLRRFVANCTAAVFVLCIQLRIFQFVQWHSLTH